MFVKGIIVNYSTPCGMNLPRSNVLYYYLTRPESQLIFFDLIKMRGHAINSSLFPLTTSMK